MRTTKPISTISFNSPEFLALKLRELQRSGRISFWAFIPHKPEDDESGKKPHQHLFVEPSKMLQTDDLKTELQEFDPKHPGKPLGVIAFRSTKFDDWYLYGLHDKRYLSMKGIARRFHYEHSEFLSSDPDDLLFRVKSIDLLALSRYADMMDAQEHGLSWAQYFARGTVPIHLVSQFEKAWQLLRENRTIRNSPNHPNVDPDTGELIQEGGDPS